jgi:hypothetical protein
MASKTVHSKLQELPNRLRQEQSKRQVGLLEMTNLINADGLVHHGEEPTAPEQPKGAANSGSAELAGEASLNRPSPALKWSQVFV